LFVFVYFFINSFTQSGYHTSSYNSSRKKSFLFPPAEVRGLRFESHFRIRESICCFVVFSNLLRSRNLYVLVSLMTVIFWDVFCLSFLANSSIRPMPASTGQARGQRETLYQQCVRVTRGNCALTHPRAARLQALQIHAHIPPQSPRPAFSQRVQRNMGNVVRERGFFLFCFFRTGRFFTA